MLYYWICWRGCSVEKSVVAGDTSAKTDFSIEKSVGGRCTPAKVVIFLKRLLL